MIIEADIPKKTAVTKMKQELLALAASLDVIVSVNQAEAADI